MVACHLKLFGYFWLFKLDRLETQCYKNVFDKFFDLRAKITEDKCFNAIYRFVNDNNVEIKTRTVDSKIFKVDRKIVGRSVTVYFLEHHKQTDFN